MEGVPLPSWQQFIEMVFKAHESGGGAYIILWLFLSAMALLNVVQFRQYRANTSREIAKLEQDIREYEEKYKDLSIAFEDFRKRYGRVQKKLSITTGMMISMMGTRVIPETYWKIMMDDNSEEVPQIILSTSGVEVKEILPPAREQKS